MMRSTILTIMFALATLTGQAQSQVNNFKIDVKVTQGIEDAGYLVHVFDRNQSQRRFLDRITVTDKRTSFSTHVDEPLVGDLTAIFPDGTVCTACVRFPFVPGEQVQVKVKNGTFELSGSTFYQQWADADELEENAHKYYKQWETDSIILNYLKKHADEEGCVMRYWQYEILPRTTILSIIPESMKNGRFKYFFAQYQPEAGDDVAVTSQSSQTATTYSAPSQSSSVPVYEPSPLQKMQLEQKAMSIKSDMDAIKALYTSLGPFYEAKIFYGTDDIFASITRQNKALDKKCQDIIKTLKDLHAPQPDEARMLNDFYKEIVKFFTEQNKGYVELNRELGDLPNAAKKAQKYINQLAGKYLVEMSKVH